jgi:hypothetical protein
MGKTQTHDIAEGPHHAAALDEFAGHQLPRLPLAQQHRDAIVATAQLADLEEQRKAIACGKSQPQGGMQVVCSLCPLSHKRRCLLFGRQSCMTGRTLVANIVRSN